MFNIQNPFANHTKQIINKQMQTPVPITVLHVTRIPVTHNRTELWTTTDNYEYCSTKALKIHKDL